MVVRAKSLGFYGGSKKRPDAVFTLTDEKHFSEAWMEKVKDAESVAKATAKSAAKSKSKANGDAKGGDPLDVL